MDSEQRAALKDQLQEKIDEIRPSAQKLLMNMQNIDFFARQSGFIVNWETFELEENVERE